MKKITILLPALFLLTVFIGCKSDAGDEADTNTTTDTLSSATDTNTDLENIIESESTPPITQKNRMVKKVFTTIVLDLVLNYLRDLLQLIKVIMEMVILLRTAMLEQI